MKKSSSFAGKIKYNEINNLETTIDFFPYSYHVDMMRCFEKQMEDLSCLDDDARRYNMELIKSIVVDLANFACGEYTEDSDRCDNLKLPKDKYNPKEKFTSRVRSMFFVLLHVAESIDNFAIDT